MNNNMEIKINYNYVRQIINGYLMGNYNSKSQYCESIGIDVLDFNHYLELANDYLPDLYASYVAYTNKQVAELNKKKAAAKEYAKFQKAKSSVDDEYFSYIYQLLSSNEMEPDKIKRSVPGSTAFLVNKRATIKTKYLNINTIFENALYKTYLVDDEEMINIAKEVVEIINSNQGNEFNAFDYAMLCDVPFSLLYPTIKKLGNLSKNDYQKLAILMTQYKELSKPVSKDFCIESIMKCQHYNLDGELLIDDEGKAKIINFLENNGIPLTYFNLALKYYTNKSIDMTKCYIKKIPNNIRLKIEKNNLMAIKEIEEIVKNTNINDIKMTKAR